MSDFLNRMKSAAKADLKTIVLPEGEDPRTIVAATKIIEEGLAKIVILGNPDEINVPGATVIDPRPGDGRHLLWHHDGQDGRRRRPGLRRLPLHRRYPAPRAADP